MNQKIKATRRTGIFLLLVLLLLCVIAGSGQTASAASKAKKNGWVNGIYYKNGKRANGEMKIRENGKYHYVYFKKGKKQTGFKKLKNPDRTCYYDKNGYRVTGSKKIKGKYYYFRKSNGAMAVGWATHKKLGGDVYYNAKGQRVLGTKKIFGVKYKFNKKTGVLKGKRLTVTNAVDNQAGKVLKKIGTSLRAAYDWSRMPWIRDSVSGAAGVRYFAKQGFNNHYGNCYVMAGTTYDDRHRI